MTAPSGGAEPTRDLHTGPWFDNHCHLGLGARGAEGPSPDDQVADARRHGVVGMVTVGTDAASSAACLAEAARHPDVWATAGVHPHDATEGTAGLRRVLDAAAGTPDLVAVGECGLDYHYDHSPREVQRRVFAEQVQLAHELDLPLVIHTRDAWADTFAVLDELGCPRRTVFHCFTGGPGDAEQCLARGALLSVSGIVTFPGAGELREAVARTPLGSLMVETDTPYLSPVPHRGKPNRPAWVAHVGAGVAELHDVEVEVVAETTTATARSFYGRVGG